MEGITETVSTPQAEETQAQTESQSLPQPSFATVGAVYEDGLSLLFDGEEEPGEKHYKCNTSVVFSAGDRVKIAADSGTFVVEYVVGSPKQGGEVVGIPSGGAAGRVLRKRSAADYDVAWSATGLVPAGGSTGQVLTKANDNDYILAWSASPGQLPTGGAVGQYLCKTGTTDYTAAWQTLRGLAPSGGSAGQVLAKSSGTDYAFTWQTISGQLPSGGSNGQVLVKSGSTNYAAVWQTLSGLVPSGGSSGQVLAKSSGSDYALAWKTIAGMLPSGGSSGQYLYKTGSSDYAVGWTNAPTVAKLVNGDYYLQLSSSGLVYGRSKYYPLTLGNSSYPLASVYTESGTFGTSSGKIGFFGATPIAKQTLSTSYNNMGFSSATDSNHLYILNNVVGILKKLGLMS